ncbi:MAG: zf-HC2 domain-containing protein [Oscillospiraceae bacterium]|nr:zf-HC2 domain-containing protein [Oscillospiraceae bacterium]MBQ3952443.1 zf-HC2 domain-containing protein [Oscillospiraceae bacterium]MBQ3986817.1 zf-HC2 domain-containing protein [Oscillospiraceae bacterium]
MPNCEDFRELISKYFDGELSADETAELNEHIAGCEDCSRFMNAYSLFLDSVPEDAEPPAELLSGVMSGVRAIKAKNKKRRRALIIRWTAAAASFALVIFAGLSLFRGGYKSADTKSAEAESATSSNHYLAPTAPDDYGADFSDADLAEAPMDMAPVPEPEPAFPADSFDGAIDDTYKNETIGADPGEAYEPEAEPVTEGETVGGLHVTYVDGMCAEATELFADREWEIEPSGDEANEFWVLFHYLIDWEKALAICEELEESPAIESAEPMIAEY